MHTECFQFLTKPILLIRMTLMENITKDPDIIHETTLETGDLPTTPVHLLPTRSQDTGSKETGGSRRSQEQEVWT